MQSQKAVSGYFTSKQIVHFGSAEQNRYKAEHRNLTAGNCRTEYKINVGETGHKIEVSKAEPDNSR